MILLELLALLLAAVLLGSASALWAGVIVQDDVAERFREMVWRHFPREGQSTAPVEDLEGSSAWGPTQGTFLGNMITCPRCTGFWATVVLALAWWLAVAGFPGTGVADGIVLSLLQLSAACTVQRAWNAHT